MAFSPGEMIALAVIFSILPLIAVGLRVWARRIMQAKYNLDDYFIFVALVITITSGFTIVYGKTFHNLIPFLSTSSSTFIVRRSVQPLEMVKKRYDGCILMRGDCADAIYGENGRHQDLGPHGELIMTPRLEVHGKVPYIPTFLSPPQPPLSNLPSSPHPTQTKKLSLHQVRYASQLLDLLSFASAKLSVLFLYRRIFALPTFTRIANVFIAIVCAWAIAFFFTLALQCMPVSVQWTMLGMDQAPHCINLQPVSYTNSISDFVLDLVVLALPVPMLWKLNLSPRKKCAVAGMFALGGV